MLNIFKHKQKRTYTKPIMNEEHKQINQTLAKNFKYLRKKHNLTQAQIGLILNVTFQQVQKYEKGINRIPASSLFVLAGEWNISVNEFIKGE